MYMAASRPVGRPILPSQLAKIVSISPLWYLGQRPVDLQAQGRIAARQGDRVGLEGEFLIEQHELAGVVHHGQADQLDAVAGIGVDRTRFEEGQTLLGIGNRQDLSAGQVGTNDGIEALLGRCVLQDCDLLAGQFCNAIDR